MMIPDFREKYPKNLHYTISSTVPAENMSNVILGTFNLMPMKDVPHYDAKQRCHPVTKIFHKSTESEQGE